jgi:UDP-3-O-[3-hydroxymyristoyl] glucosamine N-acyltransferase
MTGIGGSAQIADGVIVAGHVGISDGINVGTRAIISAKAGVVSDVPPGAVFFGVPAGPHKDQMRSFAALRKLPDFMRKAKKLEKLAEKLKIELDEAATGPESAT